MDFKVDYSDVQRFNVQIGRKLTQFPNEVKEAIRKSTLSIERQAKTNLTNMKRSNWTFKKKYKT